MEDEKRRNLIIIAWSMVVGVIFIAGVCFGWSIANWQWWSIVLLVFAVMGITVTLILLFSVIFENPTDTERKRALYSVTQDTQGASTDALIGYENGIATEVFDVSGYETGFKWDRWREDFLIGLKGRSEIEIDAIFNHYFDGWGMDDRPYIRKTTIHPT